MMKGRQKMINSYEKKLEFLNWEFGTFFHFGIRSFYPGHVDWDGKAMPAEGFNPTLLDCEQWIRTIKAAGAKYAIMTAKHHDGFALWPSKYSNYSVANTPWRDGKGDVVREFVDACRKYGIKVGLYYSPAQWGEHAIPFSNAKEYDDYFINQIGELLTGYGKIDYLWFDGCGSEGHVFDKKRIVAEIERMQPEILTFCDPEWTAGVRWVGNEDGYASLDNPLIVDKTSFSVLATEEQKLSSNKFLPAECDCKLRSTWFYDLNEDSIKSLDELFGMYEMSVGHGSNFLLNIGPDNRGLLPDADVTRVLELGERISQAYREPIPFTEPSRDGDTYSIIHRERDTEADWWTIPKASRLSNTLVIEEDLTCGQSVESFSIYGYMPNDINVKVLLFEGKTIGHKVICRFSAIRCSKYEVVINKHVGDHAIKNIKAYFVK